MLFSDVIDLAQNGVLKQIRVKDDKQAIIGFINLGILEIFKRFNLWRKEASFTVLTGVTTYTLDDTDSNVTMDLSNHNFIMIHEVFEFLDDKYHPLTLNDIHNQKGVFTPVPDQVEIGSEVEVDDVIKVFYRASPLFKVNERDTLPLHLQYLEALLYYVGYCGHGSIKNEANTESNVHYQRFEASITRVKQLGLHTQDELVSHNLANRGFS